MIYHRKIFDCLWTHVVATIQLLNLLTLSLRLRQFDLGLYGLHHHCEGKLASLAITFRLSLNFSTTALYNLLHDEQTEPYALTVHFSCAM